MVVVVVVVVVVVMVVVYFDTLVLPLQISVNIVRLTEVFEIKKYFTCSYSFVVSTFIKLPPRMHPVLTEHLK